jgi:hypothetical protein
MGYLRHLALSLRLSLALFIHAFIPSVLKNYVTSKICKDKNKLTVDQIKSSDYF